MQFIIRAEDLLMHSMVSPPSSPLGAQNSIPYRKEL